jgi:predicted dehydrogenase
VQRKEPIRLGLIGCCERMLQSYIPAARRTGFEIRAVYDPNEGRMLAARRAIGHSVLTPMTVSAMACRPDIDAVVLAGLPPSHSILMSFAIVLEAGKPLVYDEQLCLTMPNIPLVAAPMRQAEKSGVPVMGYYPRHQPIDLPYGWIVANRERITDRLGDLEHVSTDMPHPKSAIYEKQDERDFLTSHWPNEIQFLRLLLRNRELQAKCVVKRPHQYMVSGVMMGADSDVTFTSKGTILSDADASSEVILLRCAKGQVTVNATTGQVVWQDYRTQEVWTEPVTRLTPQAYERVLDFGMTEFAAAIRGEASPSLNVEDLLVINESTITLVGPGSRYPRP